MGSTPRLRLGVLASLLVNIALELHSVVHRRLLSIVDSVGGQVQLGCASLYLPPPHQQCTEVVLGVLHRLQCNVDSEEGQVHLGCASGYLLSSLCNFSSSPRRPSPGTTRLRLVVPGLGLGVLEWSLCWPPRTTSVQVHRGQVQVQLGFALLNLDLALVDLRGVGGGLPRATSSSGSSGQVQVQLGFASLDLDLT